MDDAGITSLLKLHRDFNELDFTEIWNEGIFVFDANVLLDLYRLPESSSDDLIKVLSNGKLKGRIWVTQQALLEFLNNRHEAVSDQSNKFTAVEKIVNNALSQYHAVFNELSAELEKMELKKRHSLINPDKLTSQENLESTTKYLEEFKKHLHELKIKQKQKASTDQIKDKVIEIFKSKIGFGFEKEAMEKIYLEGKDRYASDTPPGYKDKNKDGAYYLGDRVFQRKYGDLLLWKEIIKKATDENIKHIVLVTSDVKDDWWQRKGGKRTGPRLELLNEIYSAAPTLSTFYMYDTLAFLQYAKSTFKLEVKDSLIEDTRTLIERAVRRVIEAQISPVIIQEAIEFIAEQLNLNPIVAPRVKELGPVKCAKEDLYEAIYIILKNVLDHGSGRSVLVYGSQERGEYEVVKFTNKSKEPYQEGEITLENFEGTQLLAPTEGGAGLFKLNQILSRNGISFSTRITSSNFTLELKIKKSDFIQIVKPSGWDSE